MEVMRIYLEDKDDQLRVITDTKNLHCDCGMDFEEGYPEVAKLTRNHLLGVIADMDWGKWIQRTVNEGIKH